MDWLNGIDTIAHLYSYNQPGKTIAVLGNGFHHIFPEENIKLYKKILDNDGLIISEYPPDTKCQSKYFLERNRIVSGLSLGTLVIEAAFRSGTSVTAKLALSQHKKVFTLPHEIWNAHGVGTNLLLKNGAILITCVEDIFQELTSLKKQSKKYKKIQKVDLSELNSKCSLFQNFSNSVTYCSELEMHTFHYQNLDANPSILSPDFSIPEKMDSLLLKKKTLNHTKFKEIYELISLKPISINEICKKTSKSVSEVSSALFSLELEGYIRKVAGGYICILNN